MAEYRAAKSEFLAQRRQCEITEIAGAWWKYYDDAHLIFGLWGNYSSSFMRKSLLDKSNRFD
jgi:hypothetical protein